MPPEKSRSDIRFFRCSRCDHKNRYGREWCSNCGWRMPAYNRPSFIAAIIFFVALIALVAVL